MPSTPTTQNPRGYGDIRQNDVNMPNAVNAIKNEISRDVELLSENAGTGGGGNSIGTVSTVSVPANRYAWTDSGVVVTRDQPFIIEAEGQISHDSNTPAYGPYSPNGAYLVWVITADGSIPPDGPAVSQKDYRMIRTGHRLAGRLVYRIHDAGGGGDNSGLLAVKTHVFDDLVSVLAPLSELAGLRDSINALSSRVSALESS